MSTRICWIRSKCRRKDPLCCSMNYLTMSPSTAYQVMACNIHVSKWLPPWIISDSREQVIKFSRIFYCMHARHVFIYGKKSIYICGNTDTQWFNARWQWTLNTKIAGPSKKLAKNAAAKSALATLCDISYSPMQFKAPTENAPIESDKKQTYELPQPFADAIGK